MLIFTYKLYLLEKIIARKNPIRIIAYIKRDLKLQLILNTLSKCLFLHY